MCKPCPTCDPKFSNSACHHYHPFSIISPTCRCRCSTSITSLSTRPTNRRPPSLNHSCCSLGSFRSISIPFPHPLLLTAVVVMLVVVFSNTSSGIKSVLSQSNLGASASTTRPSPSTAACAGSTAVDWVLLQLSSAPRLTLHSRDHGAVGLDPCTSETACTSSNVPQIPSLLSTGQSLPAFAVVWSKWRELYYNIDLISFLSCPTSALQYTTVSFVTVACKCAQKPRSVTKKQSFQQIHSCLQSPSPSVSFSLLHHRECAFQPSLARPIPQNT